jgi:3-oxoacyl-[acyl-carrier protein] reductase
METLDLSKHNVLVTGAGSAEGIGFACALAFAQSGARVAITATRKHIFERLAELGSGHLAYTADLVVSEEVEQLVRSIERDIGDISIVINNAGMVQKGKKSRAALIEKLSDEDWHHQLSINVTTAFKVTRAVLPRMQKGRFGRIVNIASVTGPIVTSTRSVAYASAKAAMTGLTRATALENAKYGITCNAVLPGWIATGSVSAAEIRAGKASPTQRSGRPNEVAACALFLASAGASYVNGAMLVVDGANSLMEMKTD